MKHKHYIAIVFAVSIFVSNAYASNSIFTLRGLKEVAVEMESGSLVSSQTKERLLTEVKLKLKSAGIQLGSKEKGTRHFLLLSVAGEKRFTGDQLLAQVFLIEDVTIDREKAAKGQAFTYVDQHMIKAVDTNKEVYAIFMEVMLIKFIDQYLRDNI